MFPWVPAASDAHSIFYKSTRSPRIHVVQCDTAPPRGTENMQLQEDLGLLRGEGAYPANPEKTALHRGKRLLLR